MVIFPGVVVYGQEAVQLRIGCKLAIVAKQSVEVSARLKKRINLFKDAGQLSNEECLSASPISVDEQGKPAFDGFEHPGKLGEIPIPPEGVVVQQLYKDVACRC